VDDHIIINFKNNLMSNRKLSIPGTVTRMQVFIDNVMTHPLVVEPMANAGYTTEILTAVKVKLENLYSLILRHEKETREKQSATVAVYNKRDEAHEASKRIKGMTAICFLENPNLTNLDTSLDTDYNLDDWVSNELSFVNTVIEDAELCTALATRGVSAEEISAYKADIEEVRTLRQVQITEKGEMQYYTEQRDQLLTECEKEVGLMIKVARIVFAESPQTLEILGIFSKNR
jgi:hypothetical protein